MKTRDFYVSEKLMNEVKSFASSMLPSDIIYTVSSAFFNHGNRAHLTKAQKEFYRKTNERLLRMVKNLRKLESEYI
jgi:hypothetical protein